MKLTREEENLLTWAMAIVRRECATDTYGTVTIHLEAGKITRVITARNEIPENVPLTRTPPVV